jgi:hypothetical protein
MDHFHIGYAANQARQQEMLRVAEAHRFASAAKPRRALRNPLAALRGRPARQQAPASDPAAADC